MDEEDQEYRRVQEELEVVSEVPGPGRAHILLRPEIVDVEEVPPPELGAVRGVLHGAVGAGAEVEEERLDEGDEGEGGREEAEKSVTNYFQPKHQAGEVLDLVPLHEEEVGHKETAEEEEGVDGEESLLHRLHGEGVLDDVEGPEGVVQEGDGKVEGVAENDPVHAEEPDPVEAVEVVIVGDVEQFGKIPPDGEGVDQESQIVRPRFRFRFADVLQCGGISSAALVFNAFFQIVVIGVQIEYNARQSVRVKPLSIKCILRRFQISRFGFILIRSIYIFVCFIIIHLTAYQFLTR